MNTRFRRPVVPRSGMGSRVTHAPRWLLVAGFLLASAGTGTHAGPMHPLAVQLAALKASGMRWEEPQSVDMSGVPIHIRSFSSHLDATRVAQNLALEARHFQHLTTFGRTLMLSGLEADAHWLARIDVSAEGSNGYVSVLASAAALPIRGEQELDLRAWLPDGAAALYRHRSTLKGRALAQYVYAVSASVHVSMAYVRRQLRRQGWAHEPSFAGISSRSVWSRKGSELAIFASAQPEGSALYIQHLE